MSLIYNPKVVAFPVETIAPAAFWRLPDYSETLPRDDLRAAQRVGFRWRRWAGREACPSGWVTGEYGPVESTPEGDCNTIVWRRVVFAVLPSPDPELPSAGFLPTGTGFVYHHRYRLFEGWCDRMGETGSILSSTWLGLWSGLDRVHLARR